MTGLDGLATGQDDAQRIDDRLLDLWRVNPWLTSYMIGAIHGQTIDVAQQEREHAMYAALCEHPTRAIAEVAPEREKQEAERQKAALQDWEDEGGSTAASPLTATPARNAAAAAG